MNDKNLSKTTKKELIELLESVMKQNNQLVILKGKYNNIITIKDNTISLLRENEELQNKIINYKNKTINYKNAEIEILKHFNKALKKRIKYSIMFQIAIIVSALLIIFFI